MAILVVEMNPDDVNVDEDVFPDTRKDILVYDHLRHYCSTFSPLPAINVYVTAAGTTVTRGHHYLSIAKDLGRTSIRAIVEHSSSQEAVARLLKKPTVKALDWQTLRAEEDAALISYGLYVFFFERPLGAREREIFEQKIVGFLKQIKLPPGFEGVERVKRLDYPYAGQCAEVEAFTPTDERWFAPFRAAALEFHENVTRIVSFQGTKFSSISS